MAKQGDIDWAEPEGDANAKWEQLKQRVPDLITKQRQTALAEVQRTGLHLVTPEYEGEADGTLRVTLFPATSDQINERLWMELTYIENLISENAQALRKVILDSRHNPEMSPRYWKNLITTIIKAGVKLRKDKEDRNRYVVCEGLPADIIEKGRMTCMDRIAELRGSDEQVTQR